MAVSTTGDIRQKTTPLYNQSTQNPSLRSNQIRSMAMTSWSAGTGAGGWSSYSRVWVMLWVWGTFDGFLTWLSRMEEVYGFKTFITYIQSLKILYFNNTRTRFRYIFNLNLIFHFKDLHTCMYLCIENIILLYLGSDMVKIKNGCKSYL